MTIQVFHVVHRLWTLKGCYMVLKIFFQMSLKVKLRLYPAIFSWERIASTLHTLKYFYATYVIGLFLLGESLAR
jgi:hypothetical protein